MSSLSDPETESEDDDITIISGFSNLYVKCKLKSLKALISDEPDNVLIGYLSKSGCDLKKAANLHHANAPSPDTHSNTNSHSNSSSVHATTSENHGNDNTDDQYCNRKRGRNESDSDIEYTNDYASPKNKRRRMTFTEDSDSDLQNTTNSNTNSLPINNHDLKSTVNQNDTNGSNWKSKLMATLHIEYRQKRPCTIEDIWDLKTMLANKAIVIEKCGCIPHLRDKRRVKKLYTDCIQELNRWRSGIKAKVINIRYNKGSDEEEREYEQKVKMQIKYDRASMMYNQWVTYSDVTDAKLRERAEWKVAKPGIFCAEFNIEMVRDTPNEKVIDIDTPYTMALCSGSKELLQDVWNLKKIGDLYKKQKHIFTLQSLLDFSCRDEYKIHQFNDDESYHHGLNVKLHHYQLQSLDFMIKEENDEIGFYRHFYKKGYFGDSSSYFYSVTFNELVFEQIDLPKVHGGFLCEEMGLGKTIISLALINCNKATGDLSEYSTKSQLKCAKIEQIPITSPDFDGVRYIERRLYKSAATLIIAPVSLVGQWEKECDEKGGGKIRYKRYYGVRSRDIKKYIDQDVIFTTYGILGKEDGYKKQHTLHQIIWHRIILDESHYIKNANSKASKSINKLKGANKWCLAGTPFGRQVVDILNQLEFIGMERNHMNSLNIHFMNRVKIFDGTARKKVSTEICHKFMNVMRHIVMRHNKSQQFNGKPIVQMPGKHEDVIFVPFTREQREYYDKLYNIAKQKYNYYKSMRNIGRGSIAILSSLHPARQACSGNVYNKVIIEQQLADAELQTYHVQQMINHQNNRELSRQELYQKAKQEAFNERDGECPICFECPFDAPLQTPCRHIFCGECIVSSLQNKEECPMCRKRCIRSQLKQPPSEQNKEPENEDGANDDQLSDEKIIRFDSKIKVLINELNKIRQSKPDDKSLIFTSFSKSLDWICKELEKNGLEYRTLTGSMTMNKRKKQLEQFSNDPNVKVFVLTVRSGGVGITLNAANHVFMMEPPFNSALYSQAINRAYRLGQKKKVFIHTLIMKGSIEERIWNINKDKQNASGSNPNETNVAGNINRDQSANLSHHEICKLFEDY